MTRSSSHFFHGIRMEVYREGYRYKLERIEKFIIYDFIFASKTDMQLEFKTKGRSPS